jgi:hypothetical protein
MSIVRSRASQFNRRKVSPAQPSTTEYVNNTLASTLTNPGHWDVECASEIVYQGVKLPNGYFTCDFTNEFGNLVAEGMLIKPDSGFPQTKFQIVMWSVPTPFQPSATEIDAIVAGTTTAMGPGDNLTIPPRALCIRSPSGGYLKGGVYPVSD